MKLYYSPGTCSLSPHIALREAGLPFELVRVHLGTHRTRDGADLLAINPRGQVPTLQLDDGTVLTEGAAIVQYIADRVPDRALAPPAGTFERYRLIEWLSLIGTELHKGFAPLFDKRASDASRERARASLAVRFDLVSQTLATRPWLLGDGFSVADCYLFTVLQWTRTAGIDRARWPVLEDFVQRTAARPAVAEALAIEIAPGRW